MAEKTCDNCYLTLPAENNDFFYPNRHYCNRCYHQNTSNEKFLKKITEYAEKDLSSQANKLREELESFKKYASGEYKLIHKDEINSLRMGREKIGLEEINLKLDKIIELSSLGKNIVLMPVDIKGFNKDVKSLSTESRSVAIGSPVLNQSIGLLPITPIKGIEVGLSPIKSPVKTPRSRSPVKTPRSKSPVRSSPKSPVRSPVKTPRSKSPVRSSPAKSPVRSPVRSPAKSPISAKLSSPIGSPKPILILPQPISSGGSSPRPLTPKPLTPKPISPKYAGIQILTQSASPQCKEDIRKNLRSKTITQLKDLALANGINKGLSRLKKEELIDLLVEVNSKI